MAQVRSKHTAAAAAAETPQQPWHPHRDRQQHPYHPAVAAPAVLVAGSGSSACSLAPGLWQGRPPCKARVARRAGIAHVTGTKLPRLAHRRHPLCVQQRQHTHSSVFGNNHSQLTAAAAACRISSIGDLLSSKRSGRSAPCTCGSASSSNNPLEGHPSARHFHQWSLMGRVTSASTT
ncbi:MAG: hypothetical protein WDW38_007429 [Sanguina aurantia]